MVSATKLRLPTVLYCPAPLIQRAKEYIAFVKQLQTESATAGASTSTSINAVVASTTETKSENIAAAVAAESKAEADQVEKERDGLALMQRIAAELLWNGHHRPLSAVTGKFND